MFKTKRQIFATVNNTLTFRLREIMFEDQSPSLSIRGHPCSKRQFILPIKSEKFIGSELTLVSTQSTDFFSLDEPRDRSPARLNFRNFNLHKCSPLH